MAATTPPRWTLVDDEIEQRQQNDGSHSTAALTELNAADAEEE